jgi:hypothetical protein
MEEFHCDGCLALVNKDNEWWCLGFGNDVRLVLMYRCPKEVMKDKVIAIANR